MDSISAFATGEANRGKDMKETDVFPRCSRCKARKPATEFGKCSTRKHGVNPYCRQCRKDRYREKKEAELKSNENLGTSSTVFDDPEEISISNFLAVIDEIKDISPKEAGRAKTKLRLLYRGNTKKLNRLRSKINTMELTDNHVKRQISRDSKISLQTNIS